MSFQEALEKLNDEIPSIYEDIKGYVTLDENILEDISETQD